MKIVAVEDKIVVELKAKEEKTSSGLFIPDNAQSLAPQNTGVVVSAGPNVENIDDGDTIMFHERAGMDMMLENKLYKVIAVGEVYAVLKEEC